MTKFLISLYWLILLIHNTRNRKQGGLIPYLLLVNTLVLVSMILE